jgi:hypothetical protein
LKGKNQEGFVPEKMATSNTMNSIAGLYLTDYDATRNLLRRQVDTSTSLPHGYAFKTRNAKTPNSHLHRSNIRYFCDIRVGIFSTTKLSLEGNNENI